MSGLQLIRKSFPLSEYEMAKTPIWSIARLLSSLLGWIAHLKKLTNLLNDTQLGKPGHKHHKRSKILNQHGPDKECFF